MVSKNHPGISTKCSDVSKDAMQCSGSVFSQQSEWAQWDSAAMDSQNKQAPHNMHKQAEDATPLVRPHFGQHYITIFI